MSKIKHSINNKTLFSILTALFVVIAIDLLIGAVFMILRHIDEGRIFYKYFDYSEEYLRLVELNRDYFATFITDYYDPITGWSNPRSKHLVSQGCFSRWEAYYNRDGSRKSCKVESSGKYDIICVGDSFTHGNEVDDCMTFPAVLQRLLNVSIGNFGVSGYDTIQSVLQYEAVLSRIDPPKIAILGIMYENGRRNLNSFRPVYSNYFYCFEAFLFKPYFDGKQIRNSVIPKDKTYSYYKSRAYERFSHDYWTKPKFRFPFSISLYQALKQPNFRFRFNQKINQILKRGVFLYDYQAQPILDSIRYCIDRFIRVSEKHNVIPVVIFIPPSSRDTRSPDHLIKDMQQKHAQALIINFGKHPMDWRTYASTERCHPTAEGYAEIAKFIHTHIRSLAIGFSPGEASADHRRSDRKAGSSDKNAE